MPRTLSLEKARIQFRKILKKTGTSPKVLLEGLEKSREETFQKHYSTAFQEDIDPPGADLWNTAKK